MLIKLHYAARPAINRHMKIQHKHLLAGGIVAGPLFMASIMIHGALKPDYNWLRHPASSLALGPYGWIQSLTFIAAGLLTLAFAMVLWRTLRKSAPAGTTWGPLLIGWWAIMLIADGIFTTDPASGYPLGTPDIATTHTLHGNLHDGFALPAFVGMIIACSFVFSRWFARRGERKWAVYSVVNGIIMAAAFVLSSIAFSQPTQLVAYGGLFQRIFALGSWSYITALAIYIKHRF